MTSDHRDPAHAITERSDPARITRKRFVTGAAAGVAAGAAALGATPSSAQTPEATPEASPDASPAASPAASPVASPVAGGSTVPEPEPGFFETTSTFFATAFVEHHDTLDTDSDGDLWPAAWADDDALYVPNGDGRGFSQEPFVDIAMNRIDGTPETGLTGVRLADTDAIAPIWGDPLLYNRKPTGMVAVDGNGDGQDELYMAVQDLRLGPGAFDDAPTASISVSTDYGVTWQSTETPMFTDYQFTTIFFLDYGKSQEHAAVLGDEAAGYVYAYGIDHNWRDSFTDAVPDPTALYLARVPLGSIQDRAAWEFFAGMSDTDAPTWTAEMGARVPVLEDARRVYPAYQGTGISDMTVISQGSVTYNAPLDRYLYPSWTEYTFEFYEAPQPWGPWNLFLRKDFGGYPWSGNQDDPVTEDPKNGGYSTTIPSKFISEDGRTMWVQSNWFVGVGWGLPNYNFSLRPLRVAPWVETTADNAEDPEDNLAVSGAGVTPIETSARYGHSDRYSDGDLALSEDSFSQETKTVDIWGYLWEQRYTISRAVYTTGDMLPGGGWFQDRLRVQVRQDFAWVDVTGLEIDPPYPYDETAGPFTTYTLTFDPIDGDGVRLIGQPGGDATFTSIAELEIYHG